MKHIIIAGSARSGKTTLAAMLKERFPVYNLFHGDCIREWLISLYGKKRASQIVHSDGYANAMLQLVNAILKDTKQVYIIEWSRLYPSSVEKIKVHDRCTFLPSDVSLLADYTKYMSKYADMVEKFDKWESEDLNDAELAYYIDVQARVSKKLLEIAG